MKKFYKCEICGNLIGMIDDSGVIPQCCGTDMMELIPQTEETGQEKHKPVIECVKDEEKNHYVISIKVGSEPHPMTKEHYIEWVMVETDKGCYRLILSPDDPPERKLIICKPGKILAVYAYCNIHGLWMNKDIK